MVSVGLTSDGRVPRTALPTSLSASAGAPVSDRLPGLSTNLAIFALAVAMFPRLLSAAGAPALVKFLHFPVTLGAVLLVAPRIRSSASKWLLGGLYALLCVIVSSAFLNGAGLINAVLDFLLLSEPFLLLLLLTNGRMPPGQLRRLRHAVLAMASVHVGMVYYQHFGLGLRGDDVKGVFLAQGAGHHVGGAVALTTAAYLLVTTSLGSIAVRTLPAILCALVVYFSDAKQVTLVFLASLFLLGLRRARIGRVARQIAIAGVVCAAVFGGARAFVPGLIGYGVWTDSERVELGLRQKLAVFPLLLSHHESPLNWLLGLGPGHTCGRLGQMIPDYYASLEPLGATTSPITGEVVRFRDSSWVSHSVTGSSLWSPLFFWSGLFGDLGAAGVISILGLWWLVWQRHRHDDLARFLLINILLFGVVFAWLEEPGYTMFVVAILGLRWQQGLGSGERLDSPRLSIVRRFGPAEDLSLTSQ